MSIPKSKRNNFRLSKELPFSMFYSYYQRTSLSPCSPLLNMLTYLRVRTSGYMSVHANADKRYLGKLTVSRYHEYFISVDIQSSFGDLRLLIFHDGRSSLLVAYAAYMYRQKNVKPCSHREVSTKKKKKMID